MMMNQCSTNKTNKDFFDITFANNASKTTTQTNQSVITNTTVSTNKQFQKYINHLASKYKATLDYAEIISEVMYISYKVIMAFELKGMTTWDDMIADRSDDDTKQNLAMLFAKIKKSVDKEIWLLATDLERVSYNGEYVYKSSEMDSLDVPINKQDGDGQLIDTVTKSFWTIAGKSHANPFLKWFRQNRELFLTKKQNDFIDKLDMTDVDNGFTSKDVAEQLQMDASNVNKIMDNIERRTKKVFEETYNHYHMQLLQELNELTDEYEIADWFKTNINEFKFLLKNEDYYKSLRSTLRNKKPDTDIVYLADTLLIDYYNMIDKLHKQPTSFYRKKSEYSDFNVKEAVEKHKSHLKASVVKVYKNGALIRTEQSVAPKTEPTKVDVVGCVVND